MKLKTYSMFAGIGGFDIGLEATGYFKTVMQSEIEKYPQSILRQHWPDALQVGDCTQADYLKFDVNIDVICGGFPCQDISIAGKQTGITGSRSSLFSEMIRAAEHYKPRYMIFENVRRLLSINNGEDFLYVISQINEAGYNAEWRIISAESVGAPHKRERLFIVAYRKELGYPEYDGHSTTTFAGSNEQTNDHSKTWENQPREFKRASGRTHIRTIQPRIFTRNPTISNHWDGAIQYRGRIVEPTISLLADGVPNRTHQIKAYGNAIVPQVAEYVGLMVKEFDKQNITTGEQ